MDPEHTVGLLVDHSEVVNGELDCLNKYHGSKDFRQDLSLHKHAWIYLDDKRRCLLLQQKNKTDAKEEDMAKTLKSLGQVACSQLNRSRAHEVEIIASSKIDSSKLHHFEHSVNLANYCYTEKKVPHDDWKGDEEDERKWHEFFYPGNTVDVVTISHENESFKEEEAYLSKMAFARATEYTRSLANLRGSRADPDFMEE